VTEFLDKSRNQRTLWQLPQEDLEIGIAASEEFLRDLDGARILVTGGTGFLGGWITATLIHAQSRMGLSTELVVISRRLSAELLGRPSVIHHATDIRSMPNIGHFDFAIHAATSSSAPKGTVDANPIELGRTATEGTRALLAVIPRDCRLLYLSSGAVYGPQHQPVDETTVGTIDVLDPNSAYAIGKLAAEKMCLDASSSNHCQTVIARLFSFVGPRIPLLGHFAVGNFVADLLAMRPIVVRGDGTPRRSYLYAGDLAEWCFAMLQRGTPGSIYNVGSDEVTTVEDLARRVASASSPHLDVEVLGSRPDASPYWYVPDITLARESLGVSVRTPLDVAIAKHIEWERSQGEPTPSSLSKAFDDYLA
jgi:dTDP-glucose 4,6-dehydratase